MTLYPQGGKSLYCGSKFTKLGGRIRSALIYPLSSVRQTLGCDTDNQCQSNSRYQRISQDLHNIYPMQNRVALKLRNNYYDTLSKNDFREPVKKGCALNISFQILEPAEHLRGDLARVLLYVEEAYQMPLQSNRQTLLDWHRADPPDEQERQRNDRVEQLQGTRNPFIDNPERTGS